MPSLSFCLFLRLLALSNAFLSPIITLSSKELMVPQNINIRFLMQWILLPEEIITIKLPRFTRSTRSPDSVIIPGISLPYDSLSLSPSLTFTALWNEGDILDANGPFSNSFLQIKLKPGVVITNPLLMVNLTVFAINGISVYCGFPDSVAVSRKLMNSHVDIFFISSNLHPTSTKPFSEYPLMGSGCADLNKCNNNGDCDYCKEKCSCFSGFGSDQDIVSIGRGLDGSCSQRVCPSGKAIGDMATSSNTAHALAECSNFGSCDRKSGECKCFPPFGGSACDKSILSHFKLIHYILHISNRATLIKT